MNVLKDKNIVWPFRSVATGKSLAVNYKLIYCVVFLGNSWPEMTNVTYKTKTTMKRTTESKQIPVNARQFALGVKRLANSLTFGMDDSVFHGAGMEYAQPRIYVPGDPVKFMDWKVTGRTGKAHIKEFQEPKRMPIYVLMDTSASMCVTSRAMSKYDWGISIACGLALAGQRQMSPVGLLGVGDRKLHVEPTLSGSTVMQWGLQLRKHGYLEGTQFGRKVRELLPSLRTRTLLIAITDLHDSDAVHAMKLAGQEHDCIVIHLQDPAECGIRGSGLYRGQEAETGKIFIGHGRKSWDISVKARHALTRYGIDYLHLRTDEKILSKLRFFMRMRSGGGGGAR
jgi:uncharacterized protein (DUF58 family)